MAILELRQGYETEPLPAGPDVYFEDPSVQPDATPRGSDDVPAQEESSQAVERLPQSEVIERMQNMAPAIGFVGVEGPVPEKKVIVRSHDHPLSAYSSTGKLLPVIDRRGQPRVRTLRLPSGLVTDFSGEDMHINARTLPSSTSDK